MLDYKNAAKNLKFLCRKGSQIFPNVLLFSFILFFLVIFGCQQQTTSSSLQNSGPLQKSSAAQSCIQEPQEPNLDSPDAKSKEIVVEEIFNKRIYFHPQFKLRGKDSVILDVGAHIGAFAAWVAKEYQPKAVFCFEASPITYEYLKKNLETLAKQNNSTKFFPILSLVSNTNDQMMTFYHNTSFSGVSTVMNEGKSEGMAFELKTTTLSKQLQLLQIAFVDLLKIDVEGHFMHVLQGIETKDFLKIQNIVMEVDWHPEGAPAIQVVEKFLKEKGYITQIDDPEKTNNWTLYAFRSEAINSN